MLKEGVKTTVRGRPREFDRGAALKEAMLLFWQQGYEGASIAQLTRAMKITPPSLYAAFGSKESLYREALGLYMNEYLAPMAQALAAPVTAREAVGNMLLAAARQFSRSGMPPGCLLAIGTLRCGQESRSAVEATAAMRRLGQETIAKRIQRAVAAGELPTGSSADGLAAFYTSIVQGLSVHAVDGAKFEELARICELAMAAWPGKAE